MRLKLFKDSPKKGTEGANENETSTPALSVLNKIGGGSSKYNSVPELSIKTTKNTQVVQRNDSSDSNWSEDDLVGTLTRKQINAVKKNGSRSRRGSNANNSSSTDLDNAGNSNVSTPSRLRPSQSNTGSIDELNMTGSESYAFSPLTFAVDGDSTYRSRQNTIGSLNSYASGLDSRTSDAEDAEEVHLRHSKVSSPGSTNRGASGLLLNSTSYGSISSLDSTRNPGSIRPAPNIKKLTRNSSDENQKGLAAALKSGQIIEVSTTPQMKILGCIYMTFEELQDTKSRAGEALSYMLNLKELPPDNVVLESPCYIWNSLRQDPITEVIQGKEMIKWATLPNLVFALVLGLPNHEFLVDFLRSYRYVSNSIDVARLLASIYIDSKNIGKEQAIKNAKEKQTAEDYSNQTQLRVLNVFKKWLAEQAFDFEKNDPLCELLKTFLVTFVQTDPKRAPFVTGMLQLVNVYSPHTNVILAAPIQPVVTPIFAHTNASIPFTENFDKEENLLNEASTSKSFDQLEAKNIDIPSRTLKTVTSTSSLQILSNEEREFSNDRLASSSAGSLLSLQRSVSVSDSSDGRVKSPRRLFITQKVVTLQEDSPSNPLGHSPLPPKSPFPVLTRRSSNFDEAFSTSSNQISSFSGIIIQEQHNAEESLTPTDNAHIIFESTPTQTFRIQPSSLKYAEHEKTEESEKIYMPAINSDCIPDEEVSRKGDNATTNDEKETTGKKSSDSTLKINISLDVISKKQAVMQEIIQKAPAPKVGGVTGFRHLIPETITDSLIASPTTREKLIIESILELDPSDLGQQLTIIEQKLFRNIQLHEFYCQAWTDKSTTSKSPNIVRVVNWFNHIALGVASQVINHENIKNRVSVLKKFIITAHNCLGWCNFNTCFEIVAGLNLGPVSRLKQTWKLLPKKYHEVWKVLNQFVSNEGSYRVYRANTKAIKEKQGNVAILPYIGVNLSDLTFTEDGNPTFVMQKYNEDTTPLVNFTKLRLISQLIMSISEQKNSPMYTFPVNTIISRWILDGWNILTESDLYKGSLICEPRVAQKV